MQRTEANKNNVFLNAIERVQNNAMTLAARNRAAARGKAANRKAAASAAKLPRSR